MKKMIMIALVLVASASLFTASAASKKKNVKKAATLVELKSSADSERMSVPMKMRYRTRGCAV